MRQVRRRIERSLNLPFTEKPDNQYRKPESRDITGKKAASCSVDLWRLPHTVTTLSWIDGRVGRSYITLRSESISSSDFDLARKAGGFDGIPSVYFVHLVLLALAIYIYIHINCLYIFVSLLVC